MKNINLKAGQIFALSNPVHNPKSAVYVQELDSMIDKLSKDLATVSDLSKQAAEKSSDKSREEENEYRIIVILGSAIMALAGLILSFLTTRNIIKRIRQLASLTQTIAEGDLDNKVEFSSHDELGELAKSFNKMTESLMVSQHELQKLNEHLEHEVWKRTCELERLSITDSLTGLYNQRSFYKELEDEANRALRQGHDLFLLLFDVDKFKHYNDTHGHLAGDKILVSIGNITKESIRTGVDSAFRYGGDEFTIIVPEASEEQAIEIGQRLIDRLGREGIYVSMGLSSCICKSKDLEVFLKQADEAMYTAKWSGGNRVVTYRSISGKKPA